MSIRKYMDIINEDVQTQKTPVVEKAAELTRQQIWEGILAECTPEIQKKLNEFFGKGKKSMAQEFPKTPYSDIGSDGKEAKGHCPEINNHRWYNKLVYMLDVNYRDQFSQKDAHQLAHDIGQELGYSTASVYQYATMDEY